MAVCSLIPRGAADSAVDNALAAVGVDASEAASIVPVAAVRISVAPVAELSVSFDIAVDVVPAALAP